MKRLTPKTTDFTGTSVFIRPDGSYSVLESPTLPEGFAFGVEVSGDAELYFVSSSLGAFVIKTSETGEISVLWSTRTGSFGDGTFRHNNLISFPSSITDEIVFQENTLRPDSWYESYVDFGDFYLLGPFNRSHESVLLDFGFVKVDKNFQVLDRFYHTDYDVEIVVFAASVEIDGVAYYEYNTHEIIHLNAYTGDITRTPVPLGVDHYEILGIGDNRVAVFGNGVLIYDYNGDGTFSFVAEKEWADSPSDSYIGWGYNPNFNVKISSDTIYIHDMRLGPTRRKIRAIDRNTLDLR
jgi:hypothetical protein